ncbi:MAG: low-specificity L-threonine aldolase [Rheinheimera sp.]|uniref:low-specificity L-threonine aldolase n=1 Tax=Arsukibacterium sp. UBA3155 TaxID=1946058 RepID=UPI000C91C0BA|nr:low-specificity L-threonine aldolase [Arsukibacterium sp. UBA3155]MAD76411.1 low-specificity L-threonine aldolase [Rheinheimera sp.]|tara:strand:- start:51929 stop:53005 length:1077 start_codon:yes stop_codon:yes gene_type:complete
MADFRSDTVTQPSAAMRQAMHDAALGDDVFNDDPTTLELQRYAAELLGFEAALFAPSGTQTNLIAMMSHCQRGDEAIVGQQWHTYKWEGGGMAVLGSIVPQPLELQSDGTLALSDIASAIKPDDPHFARTRLIVIENTIGGKVLPLSYMRDVAHLAKEKGLKCHIDGARLMNAAVALAPDHQLSPRQMARELCQGYDSLSLCLSKGLGCPVGSLLLGSAEFIARATRIRKMLGGGMRQTGVLTAAGLYALKHNIERLAEDHANARALADGLTQLASQLPALQSLTVIAPQTNIVFTDISPALAERLLPYLAQHGVKVTASRYQATQGTLMRLRWVCHLDINRVDINNTLLLIQKFAGS